MAVETLQLTPLEMLIDIKIHLCKTDNDILKRYFKLYQRHPDFLVECLLL